MPAVAMAVTRTADPAEASRLLESGGRLKRQSHELILELGSAQIDRSVTLPAGLSMTDLDRDAAEMAAAAAAATPPAHVDHEIWKEIDRLAYWTRLLAGGITGPVLREPTRSLIDTDGCLVAAIVVTLSNPVPHWWAGGPCLPEVFVLPDHQGRGLGTFLLNHAVRACAEGEFERMWLTVTDGNPAIRLYERFGFRIVRTVWAVETSRR
jgi:GNAT superfamily N-acetyltransferase